MPAGTFLGQHSHACKKEHLSDTTCRHPHTHHAGIGFDRQRAAASGSVRQRVSVCVQQSSVSGSVRQRAAAQRGAAAASGSGVPLGPTVPALPGPDAAPTRVVCPLAPSRACPLVPGTMAASSSDPYGSSTHGRGASGPTVPEPAVKAARTSEGKPLRIASWNCGCEGGHAMAMQRCASGGDGGGGSGEGDVAADDDEDNSDNLDQRFVTRQRRRFGLPVICDYILYTR